MAITITNRIYYSQGVQYGNVKIVVGTVAEVRTLNSAPVTAVVAPGAGKIIRLLDWFLDTTNTVAFATNTSLELITDTAVAEQGLMIYSLLSTSARTINGSVTGVGAGQAGSTISDATSTQLIANKALLLKIKTGDATAGNAGITVYADYKIQTL